MQVNITKTDILWSYIGYFFSLFTNVIILPFVMKMVPSDELGLWYTFLSVGQLAYIFEGTFSNSISRNITYAWSGLTGIKAKGYEINTERKEPNYRLLISLVKTCKTVFVMVSFIALLFLGTIGTTYISRIAQGINYSIWFYSWLVYIGALFMNLYYCYWITALRGIGALQQAQKASTIAKVVQIIASIIGLYLGGGIFALSVSYFFSNIIWRILAKYYFYSYGKIKTAYFKYKDTIRLDELKDNFKKMWYNAKKNGLTCIGAFIVTQTTTLVCSAYLGVEETASYGLCIQIVNAIAGVALIYFNAVKPMIIEYEIGGEDTKRKFISSMSFSVLAFWIVYMLEVIAMLIIGLPLIELLKTETKIPIFMFLFLAFYMFLENNHSLFNGIIEIKNRVLSVPASLISGLVIIVGELIIAKFTQFGIYGLMMVQCFVQLCYNNWKWPYVVFKEYNTNPINICKDGVEEGMNILNGYLKKRKHPPL